MKQVIIMRGIPGSGKSTWIKQNVPGMDSVICSADHYHIDEDGVYRFNPANIGKAHDECLGKFLLTLRALVADTIVVDNTNLSAWEIAPYYRLAQLYGWDVKIVRVHCDFQTATKRNVHGVPPDRVWQMYQNLLTERLPPHWKEEIVFS